MIKLEQVTKQYGKTAALQEVSMHLEEPGIYCLLGRNGAGKTTLLKLLAGHLNATDGQVSVLGQPVNSAQMPEDVYFVENGAAQFNMTVENLLKTAAALDPGFDLNFALELAQKFKLKRDKKYKQLSFGMKTMVNALLGLASNKPVLLLDEPVLGFDAIMRDTFYQLLLTSYQENPKLILVSTHLIDEIAKIAEKLIILDEGQLLLQEEITTIDARAYTVTGPYAAVQAATGGYRMLRETQAGGFVCRYLFDERPEDTHDCQVAAMSLQDFFISLVGTEE